MDKCRFAVPELVCQHLDFSQWSVSPAVNYGGIHGVSEPFPASQLASFLGMTTYMHFLPQYSAVNHLFCQLLKKQATWTWTPECSTGISYLKELLTSLPILALFSLDCPNLTTCDASATVVGAVLFQLPPEPFVSRGLSPTEQKYSNGERDISMRLCL